jgi:hypothetical protein
MGRGNIMWAHHDVTLFIFTPVRFNVKAKNVQIGEFRRGVGRDRGRIRVEFFWEKYIFFGWMNGGRNENKAERRGGNDIRGVVGIMMSRRSDMIVIRNDCCWGLCNLVLRGMHRCTGGRKCIVMFMSKCQLAERRMGEYRGKIKYVRGTSVDERKRRKGKNTKMDKKATNNNNNNNILKEALFAYLVHNFFFKLKKIQFFTFYKLI